MHVLGSHIAITVNTQADLQNITRMGKRDVWRKKKAMVEVKHEKYSLFKVRSRRACIRRRRHNHRIPLSILLFAEPAEKNSRSVPLQSAVRSGKSGDEKEGKSELDRSRREDARFELTKIGLLVCCW